MGCSSSKIPKETIYDDQSNDEIDIETILAEGQDLPKVDFNVINKSNSLIQDDNKDKTTEIDNCKNNSTVTDSIEIDDLTRIFSLLFPIDFICSERNR